MNFLAHLYLSQQNEDWMIGNFIADEVKGKKFRDYPPEISNGILMHRAIDSFTDTNEIVHHSKKYFQEKYHLYAGVLMDLFYDHFLAKNWNQFSEIPLEKFAVNIYSLMHLNKEFLPISIAHMLIYMERENWLVNYASLPGIQKSLNGLSRRIRQNPGIENSLFELQQHYQEVETDFFSFFNLIRNFIDQNFPLKNDPGRSTATD
jgi:acyl carrier protein phosphodiesterase